MRSIKTLICFILALSLFYQQTGFAQTLATLPLPQSLISLSSQFNPPTLRGLKIYPNEPLKFDFILDEGDSKLSQEELKLASESLIKHFLATLTIPETDLWVNLSPREPDRIIPNEFGLTETGQNLLAQDYVLKQLTSSVLYPEDALGKEFWNRVYTRAAELYGTANIPINTANRIWIVPDKVQIFEDSTKAIIGEAHLKVMLEEEYLLIKDSPQSIVNSPRTKKLSEQDKQEINSFSSQIMKEVIVPEIEKEVNTGANFKELRQIYHALILATWFKQKLKQSIVNGPQSTDKTNTLTQIYIDQKKIKGVDSSDPQAKEKIYNLYLEAFRKGAYDYIKKDTCPTTHKTVKRRYFSGGFDATGVTNVIKAGSSPISEMPGKILSWGETILVGVLLLAQLAGMAGPGVNKAYGEDKKTYKQLTAPASSPLSENNSASSSSPVKISDISLRNLADRISGYYAKLKDVPSADDNNLGLTNLVRKLGPWGGLKAYLDLRNFANASFERGSDISFSSWGKWVIAGSILATFVTPPIMATTVFAEELATDLNAQELGDHVAKIVNSGNCDILESLHKLRVKNSDDTANIPEDILHHLPIPLIRSALVKEINQGDASILSWILDIPQYMSSDFLLSVFEKIDQAALKASAEQGDIDAGNGLMLMAPFDVVPSSRENLKTLNAAAFIASAKQGSSDAIDFLFKLAEYYHNISARDFIGSLSLTSLKDQAEKGSAGAVFMINTFFPKDAAKSIYETLDQAALKASAEQGDIDAGKALMLIMEQLDVPSSREILKTSNTAALKASAEQGDIDAYHYLQTLSNSYGNLAASNDIKTMKTSFIETLFERFDPESISIGTDLYLKNPAMVETLSKLVERSNILALLFSHAMLEKSESGMDLSILIRGSLSLKNLGSSDDDISSILRKFFKKHDEIMKKMIDKPSLDSESIPSENMMFALNHLMTLLNEDSTFSPTQDIKDMVALLRLAKELNINNPSRFSQDVLSEIVENRRKDIPDKRPLAVLVFASWDRSTFSYNYGRIFSQLVQHGYRIMYYETSTDIEFIDNLNNATKQQKADVIIIGGHGTQQSLLFGDPAYLGKSYINELERDPIELNTSDEGKLSRISEALKPGGAVGLFSCSTGKGLEKVNNLANLMRKIFPQAAIQKIFAPTENMPVTSAEIKFYPSGEIESIEFGVPGYRAHFLKPLENMIASGKANETISSLLENLENQMTASSSVMQENSASSPYTLTLVENSIASSPNNNISSTSSPVTQAANNDDVGGIDLNPAMLKMQSNNSAENGNMNLSNQSIATIDLKNFQGFTFQITKIEPVEDLNKAFVGMIILEKN